MGNERDTLKGTESSGTPWKHLKSAFSSHPAGCACLASRDTSAFERNRNPPLIQLQNYHSYRAVEVQSQRPAGGETEHLDVTQKQFSCLS
ncbi:hypothetical protein CHARACLAT_023545 [Characodon lateralis]|uniref:Uncharacterized protein n=1 Tax=Characodon lateralis TaxID=208331 RepID=A0ABU7CSZ3_9TELE|nr:hypothetical protein [Characodon lateralis]